MFTKLKYYFITGIVVYVSVSLVFIMVTGGFFSHRVSLSNETVSHDITLELKRPVYKVKYRASNKIIDRLVIIDAFGEGQSLLFRQDNNQWLVDKTEETPSDYLDARLIMFVGADYSNPVNITWDKGGDRTGLGTDGEIYSFELSGGFGRSGTGFSYRLMNRFACKDSINLEFNEFPWVNRDGRDLSSSRLHYLWSIPADIIVSPLLILAIPFLPGYGEFR